MQKLEKIKNILSNKLNSVRDSIKDEQFKEAFKNNAYVAGGAIVSLLRGEEPNDWDIFFKNEDTVSKCFKYYDKNKFNALTDSYAPVFKSKNAITLEGNVQLIFKVYGVPEEVVSKFDFVHTQCFFEIDEIGFMTLNLPQKTLESILLKELKYVSGMTTPLTSLFRLKKYIARGWTISNSEIIYICLDLNNFNLCDDDILAEQLSGSISGETE